MFCPFTCRSSYWWDNIVMRGFGPDDWIENFRMSKNTFNYLCDRLKGSIFRQNTRFRKAITVHQRVAITLWCLATSCEYRTLSHLFGVARSTVCEIVQDTCRAIVSVLMDTYISFPLGDTLVNVVNGFEERWGYPQCAGAIDGSHIPISAATESHTDYYNRKGWYSIVIQAVVDHQYIFRDICVGWAGSVDDARILVNSSIYRRITEDKILQEVGFRTICGKKIPVHIIGDSAYPMDTWLIKPFTDNPSLTAEQKYFNYRLSRARIVVENGFGRLKARWRRLMKRNDMRTDHIPLVISACCVLHNLCEIHGESFNDRWIEENEYQQPTTATLPTSPSNSAQDIRNTLVQYFHTQQQQ